MGVLVQHISGTFDLVVKLEAFDALAFFSEKTMFIMLLLLHYDSLSTKRFIEFSLDSPRKSTISDV